MSSSLRQLQSFARNRWFAAALLATPIASCTFDWQVEPEHVVTCQSDGDCPRGMVCATTLGRCLAQDLDDRMPPTVAQVLTVEPEFAMAGRTVRLRFVVSETLAADPKAWLDVGDGSVELTVDESATDRGQLTFGFGYLVSGNERAGERPFTVELVDAAGNQARERLAQVVTFDFTPPSLVAVAEPVPYAISDGATSLLRFRFDEPVEASPTVTMHQQRDAFDWTLQSSENGQSFVFALTARAATAPPAGQYLVEVQAADRAGNSSGPLACGDLRVDYTQPALISAEIVPDRIRSGDLVGVKVVLSETPAGVPDLVAEVSATLLHFDAIISGSSVLSYRQLVEAADGVYQLALRDVRDDASNAIAHLPIGSLTVDNTAPLITGVVHNATARPLREAEELTLDFDVDEELASSPAVEIGGQSMLEVASASPQHFHYRLPLTATGLSGPYAIVVRARDLVGNVNDSTVAVASIDAVPPGLLEGRASVVFSPAAARRGSVVVLTVAANEPLLGPPALTWDPGLGNPGFAFAPSLSSGFSYAFVLTVDQNVPPGNFPLNAVDLIDTAGNPAHIELTPPIILAIDVDQCASGLHDGGNGTCVPLGACLLGFHDGGDGVCVELDQCSFGYHDGGGGVCYLDGSCANGHWDGGDGSCVRIGTCAGGYHDGGDGNSCLPGRDCLTAYHDNGIGVCVGPGQCATGYHDDGTGACAVLGACASGFHNGGTGVCLQSGLCSTNYHDGGDGVCLLLALCSPSYHSGGSGVCVAIGTCSTNHHDGGNGVCVASGTCSAGFHDGGSGVCVLRGLCSTSFHDDGAGNCVAPGVCAANFHDGGDGVCVPSTICSPGSHDGGDGSCVAIGSCVSSYHDGGAGVCVALGICSAGFHDGGDGDCYVLGSCASGQHGGGDGVCVDIGSCSNGYHDGGDGSCVLIGICVPGHHDGGTGACVDIGTCSSNFHNGGYGDCVPTNTCSSGFHDGGGGSCISLGLCNSGFHDGGTGTCVAIGSCVGGYHNGGNGSCVLSGQCVVGFHDGGTGDCVSLGSCSSGYHDGGDGGCVLVGQCVSGYRLRPSGICHEPEPPVANSQSVVAYNGRLPKVVNLTGSDPDGDALSFVIVSQPRNGTVALYSPVAIYSANESFVGVDTFTFAAYDGMFMSAPAAVTVTVSALVAPSCYVIKQRNPSSASGIFSIDPDNAGGAAPVQIYCDMTTDGGGWSLVSSSNFTVDDAAAPYSDTLTTLQPAAAMPGVWSGLRSMAVPLADVRFTCKRTLSASTFDVDLSFYGVNFYDVITSGADYQTCFNDNNGVGYTGPWARRNNLTGVSLPATDNYNYGYLEGEDYCGDTGDFTVDFDDRGMDNNQSDGTDWGEDDGAIKCGLNGTGQAWFIFVRDRAQPPGAPRSLLALAGDGRATLSWQAATSQTIYPVIGYRVYRGLTSGAATQLVYEGAATTYVDTPVINGTRYFYVVKAFNDNGEGPASNEASARPRPDPVPFSTPEVLASCLAYLQRGYSQGDGLYTIDVDGAGGLAPRNLYCDMTTAGGGWTVVAYLRNPTQWNIGLLDDTGVAGDVSNGFASGATLASLNYPLTEKLVIYKNLVEGGTSLGPQWMLDQRNTTLVANQLGEPYGWSYQDSFGFSDVNAGDTCTHGCQWWRTFGMFHDWNGFGWSGTQGGDAGCRDGNNICWMPRGAGCSVGGYRCAYLTGDAEGVVYAVRNSPQPPAPPPNLVATASDGQIALAWQTADAMAEHPVQGYRVYRGTASGANTDLVYDGDQLSFVDSGLTNGTRYYYVVSAFNDVGEGPPSNEVNTRPRPDPVIIDVGVVLPSCYDYLAQALAQGDGVYTIDVDGAGGQDPLQVYCDMTTAGGGWTVAAYIREPSQWDISVYDNVGTVGDVFNGFANGGALNSVGFPYNEKIVIYNNLVEAGASLGQQWMLDSRPDIVSGSFEIPGGWSYQDGFGNSDADAGDTCSHGCWSWRTFGMFHDWSGISYCGTQGGDYGCRDGNNICWSPRGGGCDVGDYRCAYLVDDGEGTVYAFRATPRAPTAPRDVQASEFAGPQVDLTWSPPIYGGGVTSYNIYRTVGAGSETLYDSVNGATTSYVDGGVWSGQFFGYRVSAVNGVGEGPASALATVCIGCMVYYDNPLDASPGGEWSNSSIEYTPSGTRIVLGPFTNDQVLLTLGGMPGHGALLVEFDAVFADSWDGNDVDNGEIWSLLVDGGYVIRSSFSNVPWYNQDYPDNRSPIGPGGNYAYHFGATEVNTLGYYYSGYGDSVYHLTVLVPHSAGTVQLAFMAESVQDYYDEHWCLDNVRVTLVP